MPENAATSPALRTARLVLWALVAVAAIAATVIYFMRPFERSGGMFGGPFEMSSTQGGTFTQADLAGTPSLMFFGYTFCPDVCPLTLAQAQAWKAELGLGADDLRVLFVTVDPERDSLEQVTAYLSNFGDDVIGLVGTQEQTDQIKRSYGVFSEKVEADGAATYLVNHTASIYLIDDDGQFVGTIAYEEDRQTALDKIRRLVAS